MAKAKSRWSIETVLGVALLSVAGLYVLYMFVAKVALPLSAGAGAQVLSAVKLTDLVFYGCAALAVVSAAGVAFSRSIIYSAFSLLGTLLGVAALYVFLSADFLAVTQLLVYVGGVLVLILFAVMLTSQIGEIKITNGSVGLPQGLAVFAALAGLLGFAAVKAPWKTIAEPTYKETAATLGNLFLSDFLLPFEVASLVLLAALVGAVVMAKKELKEDAQ